MTYDNGGSIPAGPPGRPQYPHYPPPYPPPGPPPRQSPRWPWIVGIAVAAVLVLVGGAVAVAVVLKADSGDATAQTVTVVYEVTGPGSARVDYWKADGGRSNPEVVPLPWSAEVVMAGEKPFVSLSVRGDRASEDPLRCRITADGATVSENQSATGSVTCDGYLGEN